MTNLKRFEIDLDGLEWDSGYGVRDAVLNCTVLWNVDLDEIDSIEELYFGWVDQDGGDHEASAESFCENVITKHIQSLKLEKSDEYYKDLETESRISRWKDEK